MFQTYLDVSLEDQLDKMAEIIEKDIGNLMDSDSEHEIPTKKRTMQSYDKQILQSYAH